MLCVSCSPYVLRPSVNSLGPDRGYRRFPPASSATMAFGNRAVHPRVVGSWGRGLQSRCEKPLVSVRPRSRPPAHCRGFRVLLLGKFWATRPVLCLTLGASI